MFLIGKATDDDIAKMVKLGIKVSSVNRNHFDESLTEDMLDEEDGGDFVCVFMGSDVSADVVEFLTYNIR